MTVRRWILAVLAGAALLVVFWAWLWLVPLARQDSPGTVLTAAKMMLTGDKLTALPQDDGSGRWLVRGNDGFDELVAELEDEGLTYTEQMGAGHMFDDEDGERVTMICEAFTTRFQLCEQ